MSGGGAPMSGKDTAKNAEIQRLRAALEHIKDNAEAWHGDDAAKGRALAVIASWAKDATSRAAVPQ